MTIDGSTWLHGILLALGLVVIGWRLARRDIWRQVRTKSLDWDDDAVRLGVALTLLVGVVLINGFVCGALSGPFPRYQARINWLVSEGAALALISMAPVIATQRFDDWRNRFAVLIQRLRGMPIVARVMGRIDPDFLRFGMVGVAGFTVDYAVLHCLVAFAGFDAYAARFISFPVAVLATWLLNRSFTFRQPSVHSTMREGLYYVGVQGAGGVANIAIYSAALALFPPLKHYLPIALAFGSAAGLCVTFAGSKYFVFKPAESTGLPDKAPDLVEVADASAAQVS